MLTATQYTAEDVFEAFLYEQNQRGVTQWKRFDSKLHEAFYQAHEQFPEEMADYDDWLIRTNSYSHRLEEMFNEFGQAGTIGSEDGKTVIKNPNVLKHPDETLEEIVKYICDRL